MKEIYGQESFYYQPYRWDQHFYVIDIIVPGILSNDDSALIQNTVSSDLENNYFFDMVMETNGQWVPIINESSLTNISFSLKIIPYQQTTSIPLFFLSTSSFNLYMLKYSQETNKYDCNK